MDFQLQYKLMTLNANSLHCRQFYACCDETAKARITLFSQ